MDCESPGNVTHKVMTLPEIRREGLRALLDRLGPAGTLRFLQQYDPGYGDYAKERHAWLDGLSLDDVAQSIKSRGDLKPEP